MEEKYLPIGTVVLLKEATKRVMITGYASISPDTGDKVFDYSGCIFPEGFFDYNQVCVFDHEQIAEVFYKGLEDDEEKEFMVNLKEEIERVKTEGISTEEDAQ
jgi:hypothetical protein